MNADIASMVLHLYDKLEEIEKKVDEIKLALIPEEEATEEDLEIIRKGREEFKKGEYVELNDVVAKMDE